jgi:hypothetical protein
MDRAALRRSICFGAGGANALPVPFWEKARGLGDDRGYRVVLRMPGATRTDLKSDAGAPHSKGDNSRSRWEYCCWMRL